MEKSEKYELSKDDIAALKLVGIKYDEFRFEPDKLCYKEYSQMFDKARPRQRGYIHGLAKKLCIDEYSELPYYVKDIRYLNVMQAGEVIDILKEEAESGDSIF